MDTGDSINVSASHDHSSSRYILCQYEYEHITQYIPWNNDFNDFNNLNDDNMNALGHNVAYIIVYNRAILLKKKENPLFSTMQEMPHLKM